MTKMGRPKSDNAKTKMLSVRLSDETYKRLLRYTEAFHVTQTEVVMKGLEQVLSEMEN